MQIVVLHSRYLSGSSSGENRVAADEIRLLREAGHAVKSWMPSLNEQRGGLVGAAARTVWSREGRARAHRALEPHGGIVHVHNLFPNLSPSVLRTGLPTVMTLHNFRLACLSATFLREGRVCEDCLGRTLWRGVARACYRHSRAQSAVLASSLTLHRTIGSFDRVTLFSAVSQFVKDKLVAGGLDPDRIRVRANFSWPTERRVGPGTHFLILSRLSPEKGLGTVIANWRTRTPLIVAGDGPDRAHLESLAPAGVQFLGHVKAEDVSTLLGAARAVLIPSICYEGSPRVIPEAFAAGVPVIASRIGGLPEHVDHDLTGILVEPEGSDEWTSAIKRLENDDVAEAFGESAYRVWQERFSPDVGLRSLEALYEEAVARHA